MKQRPLAKTVWENFIISIRVAPAVTVPADVCSSLANEERCALKFLLLTDLVWTSPHLVMKLVLESGVTVPTSHWLQLEGLWPQFLDLLPGVEQRSPQHTSTAAPAPLQGANCPCLRHHSPPTQA